MSGRNINVVYEPFLLNFLLSANLLRGMHSVPSSPSFVKLINSVGPSIEPWGTPLMNGLQLDFVPLITTL